MHVYIHIMYIYDISICYMCYTLEFGDGFHCPRIHANGVVLPISRRARGIAQDNMRRNRAIADLTALIIQMKLILDNAHNTTNNDTHHNHIVVIILITVIC